MVEKALWEKIVEAGSTIHNCIIEGIRPETDLGDEGTHGLDSMGRVEFILALEDKFKISLPDEEFEKIHTVGELAKLIEAKVKGRSK